MRTTVGVIFLLSLLFLIQLSDPFCADQFVSCPTELLLLVFALFVLTNFFELRWIALILLTLTALYAQWGILQFILQHDLGFYLVGESHLSPAIDGVAKFSVGDLKLIRAYGPFAHANTFGAIVLIGFLIGLQTPRTHARSFLLALFFMATLLSFSKAAWLGLALSWFVYSIHLDRKTLQYFLVVLIALTPLLLFRMFDPNDAGYMERLRGYDWSLKLISQNGAFHGVGFGHYETALQRFLDTAGVHYNPWEITPVHSAPLLLIAELGLLGFIIPVFLFAYLLLKNRFTILVPFIPALLFDHFFVTQLAPFVWLLILLVTPGISGCGPDYFRIHDLLRKTYRSLYVLFF